MKLKSIPFFLLLAAGLTFALGIFALTGSSLARSLDSTSAANTLPPGLIKDINSAGNSILYQFDWVQMISIGNMVYFSAQDNQHQIELWKSDGSAVGTVMVKDINASGSSSPAYFANLAGTLFFAANDNVHGNEIWMSNGTDSGTQLVKDINPGGASDPVYLTTVGSDVFFIADDGVHSYELWKSNGTLSGTKLVKEITPGSDHPWPYIFQKGLTNLNGTLLFASYGGSSIYDWDLWVSDGTITGTVMVKDFYGSELGNLTVMGNALYFTIYNGDNGTELWKTDGTNAGTVLVKDINPAYAAGSDPANLIAINNTLFFSANDGTNGSELWKSDGTTAGTVMIKDLNPSGGSFDSGCGNPPCVANVAGTLFFAANDGVYGNELWKSDGTPEGTVLVNDLRPGVGNGNPGLFTMAKDKLFFVMPNDIGNGLWVSNGTSDGTLMLKNYTGSAPARLTVAGDWLFFAADDQSGIGKELWGVFLGELQYVFLPITRK
jgi:ELWxxDGT repeat protein